MHQVRAALVVVAAISTLILSTDTAFAANVTLPLRINFQPKTAPLPAGYLMDYGQAFDVNRGFGWFNSSGVPTSFAGNTRDRELLSEQRLDTLIHLQLPTGSVGVSGDAIWKASVPNGSYKVTVGVGDPSAVDSHHVVRMEGYRVLDFVPTSTVMTKVKTFTLTVADNYLTVDTVGGTNTKLAYLEIEPATSGPYVTSVDPPASASGTTLDSAVTAQLSETVDPNTLSSGLKVLPADGEPLAGYYNTDGAASNATFVPMNGFSAGTKYTVQVNTALKTVTGVPFTPFTSTFVTGTTTGPGAGVTFLRSTFSDISGVTAMTMGPGNTLYAATNTGSIWKYSLSDTGMVNAIPVEITAFKSRRTITGLAMDPAATATDPKLWVSSGALCASDCPNYTGMVSVLTGRTPAIRRDVITNLPRSVRDHMTNGIAFGPDGRLYILQGSLSGFGAPDDEWGQRVETPMSAALLVADVRRDSRFGGTVNVNTSTGYNPDTSDAPVKVYADGLRNAFALVWHSNGRLYTAANESASGNTPAGPTGVPVALTNLPAYADFFTQLVGGKYYGHPNPARGHYVLNGGNPTSANDAFQVNEYPVGTAPDAKWRKPDLNLGLHRSPNGAVEFRSSVFGAEFQGRILVTEYSQGKDVIAITTDGYGNAISKAVVATGFYNPLGITMDPLNGRVYVAEYGSNPDGVGGKITLMTPVAGSAYKT